LIELTEQLPGLEM